MNNIINNKFWVVESNTLWPWQFYNSFSTAIEVAERLKEEKGSDYFVCTYLMLEQLKRKQMLTPAELSSSKEYDDNLYSVPPAKYAKHDSFICGEAYSGAYHTQFAHQGDLYIKKMVDLYDESTYINQSDFDSVINEILFIGVFSTGISYADRTQEEYGDYKKIAFLRFDDLILELKNQCPQYLWSDLIKHANNVISRKGEEYQISTSGQTITLGYGVLNND